MADFQVFPSISKYFQVFPSISKYFQVFPSISKYFQVFPSISKYFQVLWIVPFLTSCGDGKPPIEVHAITKTKENRFYNPNVPGFNSPVLTLHELEILSKADSVRITNIELNRGRCSINNTNLSSYKHDLQGLDYPIKHTQEEIVELRKELADLPKEFERTDRYSVASTLSGANRDALQLLEKSYEKHVNSIEGLEHEKQYIKSCGRYLTSDCLGNIAKAMEEQIGEEESENSIVKMAWALVGKEHDLESRYTCLDNAITYFSRLKMNHLDDWEKFDNYEEPRECYSKKNEDLSKEYRDKFEQLQKMLPAVQEKFKAFLETFNSSLDGDMSGDMSNEANKKAYAEAYAKSGLKDNQINKTTRQYVETLKERVTQVRKGAIQNRAQILAFINIKADAKDINAQVQEWYQQQIDKLRTQLKEDKAKILPIYQKDYQEKIANKEAELKKIEDKRAHLAQKIQTMESKGEKMDLNLKFGDKVVIKEHQHSCKNLLEAKITTDKGAWTFSFND
ncbi:PspA/IM30 family protein [Helicobacter salomonis]|uniref:PspA/IM30 family protein n=1 Tax=Helicobacter salomonis TaxID=56878 RepID=UPI0013158201|nr:hypothetical protein [Helicobacter salomonis]